jgi:hypothetical protein
MMEVAFSFKIADNQYINIMSEKDAFKINLYGLEEILIMYTNKQTEIVVFYDYFCEGIRSFYSALTSVLRGDRVVPFNDVYIGYISNINSFKIMMNKDAGDIDFLSHVTVDDSKYRLWETTCEYGTSTWLYRLGNGKYIMEVSPLFNFDVDDMEANETAFKEFLNDYRPFDIVELDASILWEWKLSIEALLQRMIFE